MTAATNNIVLREIGRLPDLLQPSVALWIERLEEKAPGSTGYVSGMDGDLRTLLRLVASSEFAGNTLIREWGWFRSALEDGLLSEPPDQELIREFEQNEEE